MQNLFSKIAFLNQNHSISDSSPGLRIEPRVVFYPVVAPVLSLFSLNLNRTWQWIAASVFIVPIYYMVLKSDSIQLLYKRFLIVFIGVFIGFYSFLYFLGVDVSYELRHYTIAAILITPAIFLSFKKLRVTSYLAYGILCLYFIVNVAGYLRYLTSAFKDKSSVYHYSGLRTGYPSDLLGKVDSLDKLKDGTNNIFYLTSGDPLLALEIRNNRVLFEDNYINFHFQNSLRFNPILYKGKNSGQIYIVYPLRQFQKDSTLYLTRFERYKKFQKVFQTKDYAIFKAIASENK